MGQTQGARRKSLSPQELDQFVQDSGFSVDEILELYKQFNRDFPNGAITPEQFLKSYRKTFPNADIDFCHQLFRTYDIDGNDEVSFGEFINSLRVALQGSPEEKLRWAFRMYDADDSGSVTEREICKALKVIYSLKKVPDAAEKAERNAAIIMKELDVDHDRQLSPEEFIKAATVCPILVDIIETK